MSAPSNKKSAFGSKKLLALNELLFNDIQNLLHDAIDKEVFVVPNCAYCHHPYSDHDYGALERAKGFVACSDEGCDCERYERPSPDDIDRP